jgi:hypothetical protein
MEIKRVNTDSKGTGNRGNSGERHEGRRMNTEEAGRQGRDGKLRKEN